jgi:hypothetical protein
MKTISRLALAAALMLGLGASTLCADDAAPAGGTTAAAAPAATPAPTKASTKHVKHRRKKGHKHPAKMKESTDKGATQATDKK